MAFILCFSGEGYGEITATPAASDRSQILKDSAYTLSLEPVSLTPESPKPQIPKSPKTERKDKWPRSPYSLSSTRHQNLRSGDQSEPALASSDEEEADVASSMSEGFGVGVHYALSLFQWRLPCACRHNSLGIPAIASIPLITIVNPRKLEHGFEDWCWDPLYFTLRAGGE